MQHEMWKVLCLLVGEGTIEQLVDSVVDGGGKYSGELCKLVCRCQLMAVVVTQWQWEMQHEMWKLLCISLSMAVSKIEHSGNGKFNTNCGGSCRCMLCISLYLLLSKQLCLLAEKSIVNRSCRNCGSKNCGSCCAAVLAG